MQILIIEDEEKIRNFLKKGFKEDGYAVDLAENGGEALYKIEINDYDCFVIDITIPKIDGLSLCKKIREKKITTPIIFLTAKDSLEDKIIGLDTGADDYLVKPFDFSELLARIRALTRRGIKMDPVILNCDNLKLNPANRKAERNNQIIDLTTREYALLEYFMRHQNQVLTKTQILEHVWDYNYDGLSNIVETYVKYLRKKLKTKTTDGELIHTMRGSGYIFKK